MRKKRLTNISLTAPLWKRVFSYIVDLFVINLVILLPFRSILKSKAPFDDGNSLAEFTMLFYNNTAILFDLLLVGLIIAVLSVLYWTILEFFLGQSVGKILFRIKVVSLEGRLRFSQALLRNISKVSTLLLLMDSLYLLNKKGLRFLEKVSGTMVIEK